MTTEKNDKQCMVVAKCERTLTVVILTRILSMHLKNIFLHLAWSRLQKKTDPDPIRKLCGPPTKYRTRLNEL